jgi:hypothetical protein
MLMMMMKVMVTMTVKVIIIFPPVQLRCHYMRVFEVPASSIFRIEELFLYDEDGGSRPL